MRYTITRSLILVCLLSVLSVPVSAAPARDRDNPGFGRAFDRLVVRIIKKVFGVRTNADTIIAPIPSTKP